MDASIQGISIIILFLRKPFSANHHFEKECVTIPQYTFTESTADPQITPYSLSLGIIVITYQDILCNMTKQLLHHTHKHSL